MLRKLLKYEFRATGKIMGAILGGAVAASGLLFFLIFALTDPRMLPAMADDHEILYALLTIMLGLVALLAYIAGLSVIILATVMILRRFYRNFFTDEGYLTFTLPTTTHSLLWTKIISGFVWMLLAYLAELLCLFSLISGISIATGIMPDVWSVVKEMISELFGEMNPVAFVTLLVITTIVSLLYSLMVFYFSMSLGSMIAKKHKVWAAVGMYFAITTVTGWIITFVMLVVAIVSGLSEIAGDGSAFLTDFSVTVSCIYLVIGTVEYFLTNMILKKKLNLN